MRIDKYLKASRIMKRRTIANELAASQRVMINSRTVKPSHEVNPGDTVTVTFGRRQIEIRVTSVCEPKKKKDAAEMYEIISETTLPETEEDSQG